MPETRDKIILSRGADVIEYSLVREILHRCSYGAVRDGDYMKVFDKSKNFSLYVNESEREECGWIRDIYVDEGFQQDCLMTGGNVGLNRPWMEMCNMNDVLELIARRLDPDWSPEPSPYIGRGWSARHYHKQYIEIIDRLGCDNELFALQFEWPKPDLPEEPPACNQTATVV